MQLNMILVKDERIVYKRCEICGRLELFNSKTNKWECDGCGATDDGIKGDPVVA